MNTPRRTVPAQRLQGFGTTIFTEMTQLALRHGAVNLGQGFPDFDGPAWLLEAAIAAIRAGRNQYARTYGLVELNQAIAAHQRRFYQLEYSPETEVTVCAGATEALFAAVIALCEPGDEVLLLEPFYDSYRAALSVAGAAPIAVPLAPPQFALDPDRLARAITPRTRALIINSPHNPTGSVFTREALAQTAKLCVQHDLIAISDEVYEHLVYDAEHLPIASFPGMKGRTVTISSAGKTFSVTGWKIGWACAPVPLAEAIRTAHQFVTFCNGTPFQLAVAEALQAPDAFYRTLRDEYRERRDLLCGGLQRAGLKVTVPAGTYFAVADVRSVGAEDGDAWCRDLPGTHGVAAIPCAAFCLDRALFRSWVRFAFCKTDAVLRAGIERLAAARG